MHILEKKHTIGKFSFKKIRNTPKNISEWTDYVSQM